MERKITLQVGGKPIPLNPFSEELVRNLMLALVGSFKKVDTAEEIEIKVAAEAK